MRLPTLAVVAAGVVAIAGAAAPAHAVTFADFKAIDSNNNIQWTQSGAGTGGTLSSTNATGGATASVDFSFLTPGLAGLANLPATFSFTGTVPNGTPAISTFGFLIQNGLAGAFSFTYAGPTTDIGAIHLANGANLLSGTFGGANITGMASATSGGVNDATSSGGVLAFSSDFLSFSGSAIRAYSLSMTSIADPIFGTPGLTASAGQSLASFVAVTTGSFESDVTGGGNQGVPEPATWAMMIVGVAGVGLALRRRQRPGAVPVA